jgi:hypothetical protein
MPTELETPSATEHLWERWHSLSHRERIKQFRELHTGEKADFFLDSARTTSLTYCVAYRRSSGTSRCVSWLLTTLLT